MLSSVIFFLFIGPVKAQEYSSTHVVVCGKQYSPLSFAEARSQNRRLPSQQGDLVKIAVQAYADLKLGLPFLSMTSVDQFEKMQFNIRYVDGGGFDGSLPKTGYFLPKGCGYRIASQQGLNSVTNTYEILMDQDVWSKLSDAAKAALFIEAVKRGSLVGDEERLRKQVVLALNGDLVALATSSASDATRIALAVDLSLNHYEFLLKNQVGYGMRRRVDLTSADFRVDAKGAALILFGTGEDYVTSSQFPQGGLLCYTRGSMAAPSVQQKFDLMSVSSCKPVLGGEKFLGLPTGMKFVQGTGVLLSSTELCAQAMELTSDDLRNKVFLKSQCLQKNPTAPITFFPKSWVEFASLQPRSFGYRKDAAGYSLTEIYRYTGFDMVRDGLEFLEVNSNTEVGGESEDLMGYGLQGMLFSIGFRYVHGATQLTSVNASLNHRYGSMAVSLDAKGQPDIGRKFGMGMVTGSTPFMNGTLTLNGAWVEFTNNQISAASTVEDPEHLRFKSKTADVTTLVIRKPSSVLQGDFDGYDFKLERIGLGSTVVVQNKTIAVQDDLHFYKNGQTGVITPRQDVVLQNNHGNQVLIKAGQQIWIDPSGLVE